MMADLKFLLAVRHLSVLDPNKLLALQTLGKETLQLSKRLRH